MAGITFVHGRAQGGRNEDEIRDEWYGQPEDADKPYAGLMSGFKKLVKPAPDKAGIEVPFYGDDLDAATAASTDSAWDIITKGDEPPEDPGRLGEFEREFWDDVCAQSDITPDEIRAAMATAAVVNKDPWNWGWVQAIGKVLDDKAPWVSNVTLWKLTKDVRTYLTRTTTREAVHSIVRPALEGGPRVVVAHSLGSVVAYWLLTELGTQADVPLFITAGSPLGMQSIKKRLPSLDKPAGVQRWINVADPRDPVALHEVLDPERGFPATIENINDVSNPKDDAHSIAGYLSDKRVAERIAGGL